MKKTLLAFAAIALIPSHARAQEEALAAVADGNTVLALKGEGRITKTPDVVRFTVAVISTGTTAQEAIQTNTKTMRQVFDEVRKIGIADNDVQTNEIAVRPTFDRSDRSGFTEGQPPKVTGYTAVNGLVILQRELSDFGVVIDRLIDAGANSVQGPSFGLADSSREQDEARVAAIQDARRKAKLYADAAGMRVSRILMIKDGYSRSGSPRNQFGFMQAMESGVPVAEGEVDVSASVDIVFELAPQ